MEVFSINIPNQITLGRLALAIVFFILLSTYSVANGEQDDWILSVSFWVLLAASLSDFLDGYLARSWNQVTTFGRVLDPVVDKVLVIGAFVFYASTNFVDPQTGINITGVSAWMVVVILLREMLVSALRSFSEAAGSDFGSDWTGKVKMAVQSATACIILGVLAWWREELTWLQTFSVWLTVAVTALSITTYLKRAAGFMFTHAALGGDKPTDSTDEANQP